MVKTTYKKKNGELKRKMNLGKIDILVVPNIISTNAEKLIED